MLRAAGATSGHATVVADHLVLAELRGHASHGIGRLATYVDRLKAGLIRGDAVLTVIEETASTVLFDGQSGFGHVMGKEAMAAAVDRARRHGIAAAGVRNSTHFGMAGVFAAQASDVNMIGIATSNAAARMPAIGGNRAVLGSNPLAISVPTRLEHPILLDMATSAAALGKILDARDRGEAIPHGWATSSDGRATTDPAEAIAGLLLPAAGPKGFGLALVLEVLSSVLTGASIGQQAGSMYRTWDRSEDLGHFFIALSIEVFGPIDEFLDRIDHLVGQIRDSRPEPGGIYLPGQSEFAREKELRAIGIVLSEQQLEGLGALAAALGVELDLRTVVPPR